MTRFHWRSNFVGGHETFLYHYNLTRLERKLKSSLIRRAQASLLSFELKHLTPKIGLHIKSNWSY